MKIVNRVYAGTVKNLDFVDSIHHTRRNRPKMVVIKLDIGTMLIFPSLKFRLMGAKGEYVQQKMETLGIHVLTFRLQTLTISANLNRTINLNAVSNLLAKRGFKVLCERELFASLLVKTRLGTVNLFTSGKCMFLGVDSILSCYNIINLIGI